MLVKIDNLNYMNKLADVKKIKKLDPQNMLSSLELLKEQFSEAYFQFQKTKLPDDFKKVCRIVVSGMGGSGLGAHFIKTLYKDKISVPIEIVNDYHLPGYVDEKTLVVISSYSGNTEEILNALSEAQAKKAKIFIITSGGELQKKAKAKKIPSFIFTTENNPSHMPRVGAGYMVGTFDILLSSLGFLKKEKHSLNKNMEVLDKYTARFGVLTEIGNLAKKIAGEIKEQSVWLIGAEHLSGNAHIIANQLNESGKNFSGYFLLPELNHHLLEGLFFPKSNKKDILFFFLEGKSYSDKIKKRISITKNILKKNDVSFISYSTEEKDKEAEAYELLVFGGFLTFYLAMIRDINPSAVPFVDYLKKELKK